MKRRVLSGLLAAVLLFTTAFAAGADPVPEEETQPAVLTLSLIHISCIGRAVNLVKMMELKPISPNVKGEHRGPRLTDAPRNGTLIF